MDFGKWHVLLIPGSVTLLNNMDFTHDASTCRAASICTNTQDVGTT